eukprot:TRINITY_DN3053_c0_g4_i1.p1 TRINITY_DN3053_c0_g4~~TRINITY_DN3053_c0_g4_i1.p1  ORF type:complete len:342 (+),score=49.00 TRINITY_DN3053_c0_g4_i1:191-1216(+)
MILKAALVAACACMACLALQTQSSFQPGSDLVDPLSRQSSVLASAKARAENFESQRCQQAKARTDGDLNWWKRSMLQGWQLDVKQQNTGFRKKKLLYVRNQKAGSVYIKKHIAEMFGEKPDFINELAPLRNYAPTKPSALEALRSADRTREEVGQKADSIDEEVSQDWNVFTVVRDPIDTAIDAYLEISHRLHRCKDKCMQEVDDVTHESTQHPYPAFHDMPCHSQAQANERFKVYLKALRNGQKVSNQFFHAYPQALKVDVNFTHRKNTFDLIADLEHLSSDLCGFSSFSCKDVERDSDHSHTGASCTPDLNDTVIMKELCDLYQVDFECFGYTMPPACS